LIPVFKMVRFLLDLRPFGIGIGMTALSSFIGEMEQAVRERSSAEKGD
jgi:hypothetical protein